MRTAAEALSRLHTLLPDFNISLLLDTIEAVETRGGVWPRIEPSYMPRGVSRHVQGRQLIGTGTNVNPLVLERWRLYDLASAASYGPWQILYHTAADLGYTEHPFKLHFDEVSLPIVLNQLLKLVERDNITTLGRLADAWNSGNARDSIVPHIYIDEIERTYARLKKEITSCP